MSRAEVTYTHIATFFTHYGALRLTRELERAGVPCRLAPTPRALSTSCGTCLYFYAAGCTLPPALPDTQDMEAVYRILADGYEKVYCSE